MKKKNYLLSAILLLVGISILQAQNLDRIALSSGGISNDTLNATIGEIFVFSVNNGGVSLDAGSQSDVSNTGGMGTSISNNSVNNSLILVYPNPVNDFLNLQINGLKSNTIAFRVINISGKILMQQTITGSTNNFKINVSSLSNGNYFIDGYSSLGETITKIKFVKL